MKHPRPASHLREKSTAWWVTLFLAILTGGVLYRWAASLLYQTEALFWIDTVVYVIVWVTLQIIGLIIIKRLFGNGTTYALAKALVVVTNPVTFIVVYTVATLFRFSSLPAVLYLFTQPGQIGPSALDWLGFMRVILAVSIVFLIVCALRALYVKQRSLFGRRLLAPAAIACAAIVLLFTHQFVPTRADKALRSYLGRTSYHIVEKHPMWACCMIRRYSSDIAATDVYYKISTGDMVRYVHVNDESNSSEFEVGIQAWKASDIDKTAYETSIKPW